MSAPEINLSEFARTPISLFLYDPTLKKHTSAALKHLGFEDVTDHTVPRNYFEAVSRLIPVIAGRSELIILHLPQKAAPKKPGEDVTPIYDAVNSMYLDIKAQLSQKTGDPVRLLSKTVPMVEVGDYLREKLIHVLFKYRVPAAFFMSEIVPTRHLAGSRKTEQAAENLRIHIEELTTYMSRYFQDKETLLTRADEKIAEKDLTERKLKYDELVGKAQECKKRRDYGAAILLLRQAIDVFPKDIEAYLESGRLYIRTREYGRSLSRFGQAEDLFQDVPAPNQEIGNLYLLQVKEKVEAGADPNSPEIKALMKEAAGNYEEAYGKAVAMAERYPDDPDKGQPQNITAIGQALIKWDLPDILGATHPAVKSLLDVVEKTTAGLGDLPLDELSTGQCLAIGAKALQQGNIDSAKRYYFHAIQDKGRFSEVCTEINAMGMKLRARGRTDDAISIYNLLLSHKPHNLGSVYWNMAVAHAHKSDDLSTIGYMARSLYTDPYLPREDEFYGTLTPQIVNILLKFMRILRTVLNGRKTITPPHRPGQALPGLGPAPAPYRRQKSGGGIEAVPAPVQTGQ